MEDRFDEKGSSGPRLSLVDAVKAIAARNARANLDDEYYLLLFLQSWWSRTYNRPLKDPILLSYTLEELLYEFYDRIEREKAYKESIERENDKIEDEKEQGALDWAEQEERRELEELKAKGEQSLDPTKDPDNIAWMEQEMRKAQDVYGETFGEDIEESFE